MGKVSQFFISLNPEITSLLESRCHWLLSSKLALLRYQGRKSGKSFKTPVAYHRIGDKILIALEEIEGRNWWRNYREPWPMELLIQGRWHLGRGLVVRPGEKEFFGYYEAIFESLFFMPKIFGIDYDARTGLSEAQKQALASKSGLVQFIKDNNA